MRKSNVRTLCECAVFLALSIALSFVKFFDLPFGGSITPASMLPVCLIAVKHGPKWGLGTAFCFSWFQILEGRVFSWGLTPGMLIGSLLLDYILAYTALGLSGLFRKHGTVGKVGGIAFACALRFFVHFLAGVILWTNYEKFFAFGVEWVNHPVLYSICYNGIYMLPETVITVILAIVLYKIPQTNRLLSPEV